MISVRLSFHPPAFDSRASPITSPFSASQFGFAIAFVFAFFVSANASADEAVGSTLAPIFNSENLDGWKHGGNWEVVDGVITRTGKGGSLTYSAAKVPDDFELTFQWKVAAGSNSGVYYRPGKMEYQVLDNAKHADGKNPRTCGCRTTTIRSGTAIFNCDRSRPTNRSTTRP